MDQFTTKLIILIIQAPITITPNEIFNSAYKFPILAMSQDYLLDYKKKHDQVGHKSVANKESKTCEQYMLILVVHWISLVASSFSKRIIHLSLPPSQYFSVYLQIQIELATTLIITEVSTVASHSMSRSGMQQAILSSSHSIPCPCTLEQHVLHPESNKKRHKTCYQTFQW